MIGEGNIVEIIVDVVDVVRRPAAIVALHALDPLHATIDGLVIAGTGPRPPRPVHGHDNHGGVIEVRIVWIGILESPTTWAHLRAAVRPVSGNAKNLARHQPVKPAKDV